MWQGGAVSHLLAAQCDAILDHGQRDEAAQHGEAVVGIGHGEVKEPQCAACRE